MGFFTKKPGRELEAELIKQANYAITWFGYAYRFKKTNPRKGLENEAIDLSVAENRVAIQNNMLALVSTHGLNGNDTRKTTDVLIGLLSTPDTPTLDDVVLSTMLGIHSMNMIIRFYYEEFPEYEPLREMIDNIAKLACPGAAWMFGLELPGEITNRWPYFARVYEMTKSAPLLASWPEE